MDFNPNKKVLINNQTRTAMLSKRSALFIVLILFTVLVIGIALLIRGYVLNNPGKDITIEDLIDSIKYNEPLNIPDIRDINSSNFKLDIPTSFQIESSLNEQWLVVKNEKQSRIVYIDSNSVVNNKLTLPSSASNITVYNQSNIIFTLDNEISNSQEYRKGIYYSDFNTITLLKDFNSSETFDSYYYNVLDKTLYYSTIIDNDSLNIYYLTGEFKSKKLYSSSNVLDRFISVDDKNIYINTLNDYQIKDINYSYGNNIESCSQITIVNKELSNLDCKDIKYNSRSIVYTLENLNNSSVIKSFNVKEEGIQLFKGDSLISNLFYKDNIFTYFKYNQSTSGIGLTNISVGIYLFDSSNNVERLLSDTFVLGEFSNPFIVNGNLFLVKSNGGYDSLVRYNESVVSYVGNTWVNVDLGIDNISELIVLSPKYIF